MAFILDNLTAILVGTTLLVALLFVQQRGQQSAIDATTRYQSQRMTSALATTIERDVENIRTKDQTVAAFGPWGATASAYRFSLRRATGTDGESYTSQFSFPTLKDPALGDASPILIVTYHVEPTGATVRLDGVDRPMYQVTRYEFERGGPVRAQGVTSGLVDFEVTAFADDGSEIRSSGWIDPTPQRVQVELVAAPDRPEARTSDQAMTSTFGTSRHARMIRVRGATAQGGLPPVDTTLPAGIPDLPGDPAPSTPTGGTASGGGSTGSTGGGSTGGSSGPAGPLYPTISDSASAF